MIGDGFIATVLLIAVGVWSVRQIAKERKKAVKLPRLLVTDQKKRSWK